jgi:hypothetical protein
LSFEPLSPPPNSINCALCFVLFSQVNWSVSFAQAWFPWNPFQVPLHKCNNCCDFQKMSLCSPTCACHISWETYITTSFLWCNAYWGEQFYFLKTYQHYRLRQATCNKTINKFPKFLCLCSLVRLNETFRVWCSWVGIINYTIRIVLVFCGFFNYHFEPHQNMKNSLFVFGFQFSQCPKELVKHWAKKVTPLLSQPHFWKSVRMTLTLPKWGLGSPLGLLKF